MHISYGCLTLNLLCYVICSRPPQVDVHHGNCTLPDRGVATGAASSVAGKTNAGVAVSVAQSADVCPGGGGVSMCLCRCAFRLALLSSARFKIFSSPVFSNFLSMQRTAVCCSVLPNLCIDIQSFHVALADIFISLLRATLEFFAQSKLTVVVFGDSTVFNTAHMAKPAQSGLPEQRVHCKETGAGKNPSVERTLCPSSLGGTKGQIYEGDKEGLLLLPALLL